MITNSCCFIHSFYSQLLFSFYCMPATVVILNTIFSPFFEGYPCPLSHLVFENKEESCVPSCFPTWVSSFGIDSSLAYLLDVNHKQIISWPSVCVSQLPEHLFLLEFIFLCNSLLHKLSAFWPGVKTFLLACFQPLLPLLQMIPFLPQKSWNNKRRATISSLKMFTGRFMDLFQIISFPRLLSASYFLLYFCCLVIYCVVLYLSHLP